MIGGVGRGWGRGEGVPAQSWEAYIDRENMKNVQWNSDFKMPLSHLYKTYTSVITKQHIDSDSFHEQVLHCAVHDNDKTRDD